MKALSGSMLLNFFRPNTNPRPWWAFDGKGSGVHVSNGVSNGLHYRRKDGLRLVGLDFRPSGLGIWHYTQDGGPQYLNDKLMSIDEAQVTLDEHIPLPFPGLREGQIWAIELKNTIVTGSLRSVGLPYGKLIGLDLTPVNASAFEIAYYFGDTPITHSGARELFQSGGHYHHPVLLHDPIRPDLAPWSGPVMSVRGRENR